MAFRWEPPSRTAIQPPLIPDNHIQINPSTFPHQTRPIAEVADWAKEPGIKVTFEMAPLARSVKRLTFLNEQLANPALQNDPGIEAAVQRRDAYQHDVRRRIGDVIEWEWEATQAWELLEPVQRVEQGCVDLWGASATQADMFGQSWTMSHASVLPATFDLKELMGFQYGPLDQGLRLFGRAEYVRRGLLRGAPDLSKAQATADRKSAVIEAMKGKKTAWNQ